MKKKCYDCPYIWIDDCLHFCNDCISTGDKPFCSAWHTGNNFRPYGCKDYEKRDYEGNQ